ncbi:MAG: type II toxin-antitoxin system death-on-curing family toxin [Opitutaceae bacterium]
MEQPQFLSWETVEDLHLESLARHGGLDGIRDSGALESALGAAENAYFYGAGDIHVIGAAYAFHLAESQGFIDGNKRTAIACAATFLRANGCVDGADDTVLYDAMIAIAARRMDKAGLAMVLRRQFPRRG